MPDHCKDHECLTKDVTEIKTDVKWLVSERKRTNGSVEKHLAESDAVRSAVKTNSAFRIAFIWAMGIYGVLMVLVLRCITVK